MTASERAAGELVADVDTLAAAIRRVNDWYAPGARELAEALVAAGFGRIDAARREALLSAAEVTTAPMSLATSCWLRDRAHQIGATS